MILATVYDIQTLEATAFRFPVFCLCLVVDTRFAFGQTSVEMTILHFTISPYQNVCGTQ